MPYTSGHLGVMSLLNTFRRFHDQMIDDGRRRFLERRPIRHRLLVDFDLAVGTGAVRENLADVFHLFNATQRHGIVMDQVQQLLHELRERDDVPIAEVDQPFIEAVTHRTPAILVEQQRRVEPPALILAAQSVEHPQRAHRERRQAERIIHARADVHDARLERGVASARS